MKNEKAEGREPLAIVGMACRFPKADDCQEYWQNIINGVDCISEVPESHWKVDEYFDEDPKSPDRTYARRGGFLNPTDFNPLEYGIPPTTIEATDTSQLLGMVVAGEALADAGYAHGKRFDRDRVSVILGVTGALELVIPLGARLGHPIWRRALREAGIDEARTEAIVQKIADGYVPWQEQSFPGLLGNVVAGRIANYLDLGGTNCVADAACASALSALHLAAMELWSGRSDMVLTGGIDTFNDIFMYMCFSKTPALSPGGDAKPFHENGDGTILGEGLGVVVLKRLADAERDGDRIYAVIRGLGASSDGKGNAIYAPSAKGQVKALRRAYQDAEVEPETVGLVEGHGTGTKVGDATEIRALDEVYRDRGAQGTWCAVGSVKSQIGHTKAAAGSAGLIKAALALHHKILPPSIKAEQPLEELRSQSPFYLNHRSRPWMPGETHPRRAGVSAFGFGGSNFHCVLEEYQPEKKSVDWDSQVQIFALSATDKNGLLNGLKPLAEVSDWRGLAALCEASRREFDAGHSRRILILIEKGKTDPVKIAQRALALIEKYGVEKFWSAPEGIYFGQGKRQGKLGVLFPGQGAQYIDMMRDLACRFPSMQQVLADVDKAFAQCDDERPRQSLTNLIYPLPSYSEEARREDELRLRQTQNAQPAIGAVSIGALKILNYFGVEPEAAAGHSYGEITALCASRCFDTEALYLLSRLRGRLMAEGEGDRGAMVAVRAPLADVESLLADYRLDLVLANKNAPDQVVLSGPTAEIERAMELLGSKKISNKRLPVAAAFHSTLVAQASQPFSVELGKIDFLESEIPVFSNTTGQPYPEDPGDARNLLATQLTQPVEFVSEVHNMYEHGVRTFLEVGPGARLTGLVKSILSEREFQAMAVDASSGKRAGMFDLAKVLAHLAALGYPVRLELWQKTERSREKVASTRKGMAIPLTGANYKSEATRKRGERPLESEKPTEAPPERTSLRDSKPESQPPMRISRESREAVPTRQALTETRAQPLPASRSEVREALSRVEHNLALLHRMQEQTAELHRKFLEGQEAGQANLLDLMGQRQGLLEEPIPEAGQPISRPALKSDPVSEKSFSVPVPAQLPSASQPRVSKADLSVERSEPSNASPDIEAQRRHAERALLEVVAEKTGYPDEMLELSMKLDADLGIDSIKRVEIIAELQQVLPDAAPLEPERMGSLSSLDDIVQALEWRSPTPVRDSEPGDLSSAAPSPGSSGPPLERVILAMVAEKTGYPEDMLDLSMSLDGDLGIDSIKRVEILSAVQEAFPEAPGVKPEDLGRLHTLQDIVAHLRDALPSGGAPSAQPPGPVRKSSLADRLMEIVADKTGYPMDMLEPSMSLDADLGIDSIKRVEIFSTLQEALPHLPAVDPEQLGRLHTLADIAAHFEDQTTEVQEAPALSDLHADLSRSLLEIIADKTGYPPDMLEPDMSLESDLGIDSIKRVEIFSTLQEHWPSLPDFKPEQMARIQTLAEIVDFLEDRVGLSGAARRNPEPIPEKPSVQKSEIGPVLLQIVADKTGYPAEMLELDMGLETDLGIDSIKRVEILSALQEACPHLPELKPEQMGDLRTLGEIVNHFDGETSAPGEAASALWEQTRGPQAEKSASARLDRRVLGLRPLVEERKAARLSRTEVIWVGDDGSQAATALVDRLEEKGFQARLIRWGSLARYKAPEALAGLIILAPSDQESPDFLSRALKLLQKASLGLRGKKAGGPALLATVSRLDGAFGMESMGSERNPAFGGLAGLLKTAAHEWPEVRCRALDLNPDMEPRDFAEAVVDELLLEGPIEVAVGKGGTRELSLDAQPLPPSEEKPLQSGDLVLVTGGARGVTAAAAIALARAFSPTLVLMGRTPEPEKREAEWLTGLQDEAQIKRELLSRLPRETKPAELQAAYHSLLAAREIRANLAEMRAQGARVVYRAVDLRRSDDVVATVEKLRAEFGPVKGLIHGAGVLADRRIEDKTESQFQMVYQTKAESLFSLLKALRTDPLKVLALFSSSTGRFGRTGQVDYAMANEALNKTARQQAGIRPDCRVIAVNWGPWDGGMVTPALKKLFAAEGVGLIPVKAGADYLVGELSLAPETAPVEVVLLGEGSGRNRERPPTSTTTPSGLQPAYNFDLSLERCPFLKSHVIGGKAVLPMAVMVEWLAHAALHENPGFRFQGFENMRVLHGVRLSGNEVLPLEFLTAKIVKRDARFSVTVELRSAESGGRLHARADILLGDRPLAPEINLHAPRLKAYGGEAMPIYEKLFHGPDFQGIAAVDGCSEEAIRGDVAAAPAPSDWIRNPLRGKWLADPLALDAAFQLTILWCLENHGKPSLPSHCASYSQYLPFSERGCRIVVHVLAAGAHKVTADVDFIDSSSGRLLARMRGLESTMDQALTAAFSRKRLAENVLS